MEEKSKILSKLYQVFPHWGNTDFIVGEDQFEDIEISDAESNGFWYFKTTKKKLIKRFVLERTLQTEKSCTVTLIEKENGKFTPRFEFQIFDTTKKAIQEFSKKTQDDKLIKAKVNFDTCHENFLSLINCIKGISNIEFGSKSYSLIPKNQKELLKDLTKNDIVLGLAEKYSKDITEQDIILLQDRRSKLDHFDKLLNDEQFFKVELAKLEGDKRPEDLWQKFFEDNPWIFGYGLQLITCENYDYKRLEKTIVGNDIVDGRGKRIDALLKTRGSISKLLFCEIKTHFPNLLLDGEYRPGSYPPAKDLRGAVAQVQKTIHKFTLKISNNLIQPEKDNGDPTGEEILTVKPRGVVVIGRLDDFKTKDGINSEKLSSFELYRQQVSGIEIITFDELYQRTKFIIENF